MFYYEYNFVYINWYFGEVKVYLWKGIGERL